MKKIKYENYIPMIKKRAWDISQKTGREFEELFSQGNLVFCETLNNFDPNKETSFATLLWKNLDSLHNNKPQPITTKQPNENIPSSENIERTVEFNSCLQKLSVEASQIVNLILNEPQKLTPYIAQKHKTISMTTLSRFLHNEWDWQYNTIWAVIGEIRFALQEI